MANITKYKVDNNGNISSASSPEGLSKQAKDATKLMVAGLDSTHKIYRGHL